jgi:hypothetical protein
MMSSLGKTNRSRRFGLVRRGAIGAVVLALVVGKYFEAQEPVLFLLGLQGGYCQFWVPTDDGRHLLWDCQDE